MSLTHFDQKFVLQEENHRNDGEEEYDRDGEGLRLLLNFLWNVLEEEIVGLMPRTTAEMIEEGSVSFPSQHVLFAVQDENGFPHRSIPLDLNGDTHRTGGDAVSYTHLTLPTILRV